MSTLYEIEVQEKGDFHVVLRVESLQPDCCPFYTSKRFAFGLLVDSPTVRGPKSWTAWAMAWIRSSLFQLTGFGPLWTHEVRESYLSDRHPIRELVPQRIWEDPGCQDYDWDWFITQVSVERVWPEVWAYGSPNPFATYRIEVLFPQYLDHLSEGQTWGSTAYDVDDVPHPHPTIQLAM